MRAVLACGLALWLLGAVSTGAAELAPAKLALVVPMTGEAGRAGQSMRWAAELALADWQGRLDRRVELVVHEDRFDPGQAVTLARQLAKNAVWGVVGHFYSSSSIAAAGVYAEAGIPQITATATHPRLTARGYSTVFRVVGRDDQQAATAADFAQSRLRSRRIALIHDGTEYGRVLAETFRETCDRSGLPRVVLRQEIAQGNTSFPDLIARIVEARPDAVYFGGIFREAGLLLRQMRQARAAAAFLGGDGVLDPEFVTLAGEAALADVYLTSLPDPWQLATASPVIERYEGRYGALGPHALYAYDAVGAYLWAYHLAKPRSASPEELGKLLRALRGGAYPGALGILRWDARGDRAPAPYVVYTVKQHGSLHGWFEQVPPAAARKARQPGEP